MIGHAAKDEKGKYKAGVAGDQTKKEVYTRTWYNRPWNCIVRAKDGSIRNKIAEAMEKACANNKIGYDQNQRNTLLTLARKVNYDPAKVTTSCETDCSALTSVCCMYAGVSESYLYRNGNSCTTRTLRNALLASGMFDVLTESKYRTSDKYLLRGDILLYEGHHVAVNLTDGTGTVQTESKQINPYVEPTILLTTDKIARKKKYRKDQYTSSGDSVKWHQFELRQAGFDKPFTYNEKSYDAVEIDGGFGEITAAATTKFQQLYNLKQDAIVGSATRSMLKRRIKMRGIDVAKWQGTIDWKKVKDSGCEFAILKVIDRSGNKESSFDKNYSGCVENNIPVGVYNYSYATDITRAKSDANKVVSIISGKPIPFKVWLDVEDKCQKGIGQRLIDIINSYKKIIVSAGFEFGVYTGLSFYNSYLKPYANQLDCKFWIARYPSNSVKKLGSVLSLDKKPVIKHELFAWQYSSKGSVPGIKGDVDLNESYENVAATKPTPVPTVKKTNPYIEPSVLLKKGTESDSVRWLQWELVQAGFNISIDGAFGPATDRAVKSFQKLYNLKIDGIVGGATRSMLKVR